MKFGRGWCAIRDDCGVSYSSGGVDTPCFLSSVRPSRMASSFMCATVDIGIGRTLS